MSTRNSSLPSRWTRAVEPLLWLYLAGMAVLTVAGVGRLSFYGDEIIHIEKIQTFLTYGVYALAPASSTGFDISSANGYPYSYGPLFSLIGHLVAVATGAEAWGSIAATDAAFAARHFVVIAFSFLGVAAAGWGVALVTRSRVWGLATSALLMSIPMWTGSAIFNVKDIPIAAGYTLFTSGCIALTLPAAWSNSRRRIEGFVAVYFGTLILWGVRPGTWVAIALAFAGILLIRLRFANFAHPWATVKTLVAPVGAVAASYLTMLAIYPAAFINPVKLLFMSFKETAAFPHDTYILTDGELLGTPPPWYYLPKWAAAQLPEVVVALTIVIAPIAVWLVLSRLFRSNSTARDFAIPAIVVTFAQFAAFPLAAILLKSTVYGGLRQFTFLFPGLVMLLMIILFLASTAPAVRRIKALWPTVVGFLVASTVMTTVIQVQIFPYQFSYFNPTTVATGVDGRWDIFARKLATGELWSQLTLEEREACTTNCPATSEFPDAFDAATPVGQPTLPADTVVQFPSSRTRQKPKAPCGPAIASVVRPYLWTTFTIESVYACPTPVPPAE